MAIEFAKEMDIGQGYNFKQDEHHTFGYINAWVIGKNNIAPDIKVVEPTSLAQLGSNAGTTGALAADTSGIFNKPVVAVLNNVTWSTLPNENITFQGRISVANMQQLSMLLMQSLKEVVLSLSFVVYEYDLVNQVYFTSFKSHKGTAPNGAGPAAQDGGGFGKDTATEPIYALLGKTSGTEFGIKIGPKAEEDPLGIKNHTLELTLAPPIAKAPQQILIQTSEKVKLIQPWGIPQS